MSPLQGIIEYDPSELVITVWAGTPIRHVIDVLAEQGQGLLFEPPQFQDQGSIGGMLACGLAGPARAYWGGVRDYVLGVKLLRHDGEVLHFGGTVMKNVAGFDVSRHWVGSMGRFGPLLAASLKVYPLPKHTVSVRLHQDQASFLALIESLSARPVPLSASAWFNHETTLRLAGSEALLEEHVRALGPEATRLEEVSTTQFWRQLRDHRHAFLADHTDLVRLSVPHHTPVLSSDSALLEWGGALRYVRRRDIDAAFLATLAQWGGTVTPWPCDLSVETAALDPTLNRLTAGLRRVYDPSQLYNPTRPVDPWKRD